MIVAIDTNAILPGQVGGIESYTLGLIEALKLPASPASRVVLVTRPENHELFSRYVDEKTQAVLLERAAKKWGELTAGEREDLARRKVKLLHECGAEVVHFPGNTINPIDVDLPAVLNLHDLQHRHFPQYFSAEEIANREKWWVASARRADALIAASNFVREDLHAKLGIEREKIFVTPDPFQAAFFKTPKREKLEELRERFSLPEMFFIYPAAAWPHKNHARLIEAFAEAAIGGCQLILTGGGQAESPLPSLIAGRGLDGSVRLLGRVSTEDLIGLYHLATAMIFPSQHESWSIPVMEAMACGCPVACSNVTSLPEEVGDAGLLFEADDVRGMTAIICRLAGDSGLRRALAEKGRERVRGFGMDEFVEVLGVVYGKCARGGVGRVPHRGDST